MNIEFAVKMQANLLSGFACAIVNKFDELFADVNCAVFCAQLLVQFISRKLMPIKFSRERIK